MEQVNNIELSDEKVYPDENILENVLQKSYSAYCALLDLFNINGLESEWRYYKDGKAWLCKVQYKKRTIVWLSAWKGFMKATLYFPEKYIQTLYGLDISEGMKKKIEETRNVGKSKPCTFEIRNKKVLKEFSIVMNHKMSSR